ncbi:hypothetical protein B296_00024779 [Ensete ventricosum]|uniref:Uncharacterized protein n=1 Tax=Ensete ventricosum TaxID=4639 RepID=A0A426X8H9_ENSVE|nr:hypothetical protein B296_00024779 [Ensete ventricosum]
MATTTTFEYRGSRCSFIVGLLGQIDEQEDHLKIKEDSDIVTFQWLSSQPNFGSRQVPEDVHFAALHLRASKQRNEWPSAPGPAKDKEGLNRKHSQRPRNDGMRSLDHPIQPRTPKDLSQTTSGLKATKGGASPARLIHARTREDLSQTPPLRAVVTRYAAGEDIHLLHSVENPGRLIALAVAEIEEWREREKRSTKSKANKGAVPLKQSVRCDTA